MLVEAELSLIRLVQAAMDTATGTDGAVSVDSGPGEWSGEYLDNIMRDLPAVRVAFMGGVAANETSLTLEPATWQILLICGWDCDTSERRRLGMVGTHSLLQAVMLAVHNVQLKRLDGIPVGMCRVGAITNYWDAEFERARLAVYGVGVNVNLPFVWLDPQNLDEFLRTNTEIALNGVTLTSQFNMRGDA